MVVGLVGPKTNDIQHEFSRERHEVVVDIDFLGVIVECTMAHAHGRGVGLEPLRAVAVGVLHAHPGAGGRCMHHPSNNRGVGTAVHVGGRNRKARNKKEKKRLVPLQKKKTTKQIDAAMLVKRQIKLHTGGIRTLSNGKFAQN